VVTKVGAATSVDGNIEAKRGWVDVLGRRYDIERAWIVFDGEIPPDPQLDIRVSHQFTSQLVYVDVVGRLSKPNVTFASDSGTDDQAELLGLILGGESPGEAGAGEKTLSQKATGGAASLVASRVAGAIRGAGLPVDVLQVGTDLESGTGVTDITVGKWLSERLFVAYRRRFEEDPKKNQNEAILQHFFTRNWMWEGTGGDKGAMSIDLLWIVPL
jgi:translocation and assembly module TamB